LVLKSARAWFNKQGCPSRRIRCRSW